MHIEKEEKVGIHAYVSKVLAITNLGFFLLTLLFTLTRDSLLIKVFNHHTCMHLYKYLVKKNIYKYLGNIKNI